MKKSIFLFFIMFLFVKGVYAGSVTINRYDSEGKDRLEATLIGSTVELYRNNVMVMSIPLDETGTVVIDGLEYGMYGVKQGKATGYKQDITTSKFNFYEGKETATINLYSKVIEGNLIINKYYGSDDDAKLDENSVFEVYHGSDLIKTITSKNGVINEKLEYGTYLIKQVSGIKYYDLAPEFTVKIEREQNYVFDLYTDMDNDLKVIFDDKEEMLNQKAQQLQEQEENLNNLKIDLEKMQVNLFKEKEELEQKQNDLIRLESELESKREEINILNEDLINDTILLESKQNELYIKEIELDNLKTKLDSNYEILINLENEINMEREELKTLKELFNSKIKTLEEEKQELNKKEMELNKIKEELNTKENKLISLEKEVTSREQELLKIENDNALVVNVPNTYKKSYNKLISLILIIIGSLLIIYNIKKVTN